MQAFEQLRLREAPAGEGYQEIYRQDRTMTHVAFPISGVCSVVILLQDGRQVEASMVGNEGMIGVPGFLGLQLSLASVVLQIPGELLRLPADRFQQVAQPGSALRPLMQHYAAYQLREASQRVACNTYHTAKQRMCRWLLAAVDQSGQEELQLTQEYLAEMIGTRRTTVTTIAGMLQRAGCIRYHRGVVRILQREELERCSCECYEVVKGVYRRVMEDLPAA